VPEFYQVPRARRTIAWAWLILVCALLAVQTIARAERPGGIDLTSYLLSAGALARSASPYRLATPFPYLYPPTLAFLLIPLTPLPRVAVVCLWFALGALCMIWSVRSMLIAVRPELERRPDEAAVFVALFLTFFFTVVQSNLRNGQVNFLVLALCVMASLKGPPYIRSASTSRLRSRFTRGSYGEARRSAESAIAWSLAIAIKIVPLALAPYFLLRRRWIWLLGSTGCLVILLLSPAILVGWRIADMYEEYWRVFLGSSFTRAQPLDFSVAGVIAWTLGVRVAPVVRFAVAIAVMIAIAWMDLRRTRVGVPLVLSLSKDEDPAHARRDAEAFAAYLLAIPLVSPQSEVHHLAFAFPAAVVAASGWRHGATRGAAFRTACVIAAASYILATIVTAAAGPLLCTFLIALAAAVIMVTRPQ
jgi:Glycosyltransferase family 87